jgi:voltage-dependent calcium channel
MLSSTHRSLQSNIGARHGPRHYPSKSLTMLQQLFAGESRTNDVPLTTLRQARRDSATPQDPNDDETERHL